MDRLPPYHAAAAEIVGAEFDGDFVTRAEENPVSAHVPAGIGADFVVLVVSQVASERPAFEDLGDDGALVESHRFPPGWHKHGYRMPRV